MFILAQILSFIAMVINMVAVQLKTKKQIFLTIVVSNLLFVISYILLGAYVGALTLQKEHQQQMQLKFR